MDPDIALAHWTRMSKKSSTEFIKFIQDDIIASPTICEPPFGRKKSTYTDWFASGKPLKTIEKIMTETVLPFYANTHTQNTSTARSTFAAVHNSRAAIARSLNAQTAKGHQHEAAVIFCGNGATAGILKVRDAFRLNDEGFWTRKAVAKRPWPIVGSGPASLTGLTEGLPSVHRPVVFISIQEHHSNILPWHESVAEVVVIGQDVDHKLDLKQLDRQLILHWDRPLKIGSFSAGSSLTGVLNNTVAIAEILHKYDAFAFFDYAGVGAHTTVDMNPRPSSMYTNSRNSMAYKDGVFLSPHKMVGGPGSSGVLAARLEIFSWVERHSSADRNQQSRSNPGDRTVDNVFKAKPTYPNDATVREEAGTPNILGAIRAGLAFRLQQIMNPRMILAREQQLAKEVYERLLLPSNRNITVLGTPGMERVTVFSVTVAVPQLSPPGTPKQIHHALLSMIMNDFFGIEMGSCSMWAEPYSAQLLGVDASKQELLWNTLARNKHGQNNNSISPNVECLLGVSSGVLARDCTHGMQDDNYQRRVSSPSLRPGFVRFSFPHFTREKDVEFVLQSLEWVAQYGFLLIPLYKLDAELSTWSIRQAVQNVVCHSISARKLRGEHRIDYVQVATDCIYGLQQMFQEQRKKDPTASDTPSRPLVVGVRSPSGVFYSVSQARLSLSNIFSNSSYLLPARAPYSSTPSIPLNVPPRRFDRRVQQAQLTALPNNSCCSLNSNAQTNYTSVEKSDIQSGNASRANLPVGNPSTTSMSVSDSGFIQSFQPLEAVTSTTYGTDIKDALEELSATRLEAEHHAVEECDLAKHLRWFVMPSEVAELYVSNSASLSGFGGTLPCFPPRSAKSERTVGKYKTKRKIIPQTRK